MTNIFFFSPFSDFFSGVFVGIYHAFAGLVAGFRDQFTFLRQQAGVITSGLPVATTTDTATSILIDVEALLASTTLDVPPAPVATPILIGTTSATTSSSE